MDRARIEQVQLAVFAILILAVHFQGVAVERIGRKCARMLLLRLAGDLRQADAADARRRPGKIFIDQLMAETHCFENLRAAVRLDRRDTHLGHHLDHAFVNRFVVALHRVEIGDVLEQSLLDHVVETLVNQIGIDRLHAIAKQQAEVMHLARLAGLQNQAHPGARAAADQMVMQTS